jgi:TfoX/Sxy family transcriptional regulator of competence genes
VPVQIPKPTEADKEYFRALIGPDPRVQVKPMFGNLGGFVNGNMFAGLFGSAVGVRLSEDDAESLRAIEGSGPFGPEGRPMGGYVSLPDSFRETAEADVWVDKALNHVAALPPKAPKAAKRPRS